MVKGTGMRELTVAEHEAAVINAYAAEIELVGLERPTFDYDGLRWFVVSALAGENYGLVVFVEHVATGRQKTLALRAPSSYRAVRTLIQRALREPLLVYWKEHVYTEQVVMTAHWLQRLVEAMSSHGGEVLITGGSLVEVTGVTHRGNFVALRDQDIDARLLTSLEAVAFGMKIIQQAQGRSLYVPKHLLDGPQKEGARDGRKQPRR